MFHRLVDGGHLFTCISSEYSLKCSYGAQSGNQERITGSWSLRHQYYFNREFPAISLFLSPLLFLSSLSWSRRLDVSPRTHNLIVRCISFPHFGIRSASSCSCNNSGINIL